MHPSTEFDKQGWILCRIISVGRPNDTNILKITDEHANAIYQARLVRPAVSCAPTSLQVLLEPINDIRSNIVARDAVFACPMNQMFSRADVTAAGNFRIAFQPQFVRKTFQQAPTGAGAELIYSLLRFEKI
jgi:hypothetical protein